MKLDKLKNNAAVSLSGYLIAFGVTAALPWLVNPDFRQYWLQIFVITLLYVILSTGLNMLIGVTGLLSLGHAAFYGLGAYCSALLAIHFKLNFVITFLAAGFLAGAMGMLLALPSLKLRDTYLTIVTIGFGSIVYTILNEWRELTKGPMGLIGIPHVQLFGYRFSSRISYFYMLLILTLIFVLVAWRLERSKFGRGMKAVRDDQLAASVIGVDVRYHKMLAFTLSAVYAGFAGSLYAHYGSRFISPDSFNANFSTTMLMMVIIGGLGSIPGSIIGSIVVVFLPEILSQFETWRFVIYGVILIGFMIFLPKGLVQLFKDIFAFLFLRNKGPEVKPAAGETKGGQ